MDQQIGGAVGIVRVPAERKSRPRDGGKPVGNRTTAWRRIAAVLPGRPLEEGVAA
jgi:hypothetical protein